MSKSESHKPHSHSTTKDAKPPQQPSPYAILSKQVEEHPRTKCATQKEFEDSIKGFINANSKIIVWRGMRPANSDEPVKLIKPRPYDKDSPLMDKLTAAPLPYKTSTSSSSARSLVIVPTGNAAKVYTAFCVAGQFNKGSDFDILVVNGDSDAGEQPRSHEMGMWGAWHRIWAAHQSPELRKLLLKSTISERYSRITFFSFENHFDHHDDKNYDHPAFVFWDDTNQIAHHGIGEGCYVMGYYDELARRCGYEKFKNTQLDDPGKGAITIGKIMLWVHDASAKGRKETPFDDADWHPLVCNISRYETIYKGFTALLGIKHVADFVPWKSVNNDKAKPWVVPERHRVPGVKHKVYGDASNSM